MSDFERYLPIDEEGYFVFDGRRVTEEEIGRELLENLRPADPHRITTSMKGVPAWVEAFDAPLVAKHVHSCAGGRCTMDLPYGLQMPFPLASLTVDEWDRFHGLNELGVPFVFSRQAQVEFFEFLDEFDDDSVTVGGVRYPVGPWLGGSDDPNAAEFWSNIYRNEKPGWEQDRESVALPDVLPQLKLTKSRVLVLGCGSGNDAAYFARAGHVVTAVDFSAEAIAQARAKYGGVEGLTFLQADAFKLPASMNGQFDLVFEHTCYCAIAPDRRKELVNVWKRMLTPRGELLGVFFATEKRNGPPFGGSEWELRERLKSSFDFLFWTRWRKSVDQRKGKEVVVYARRKG